MDVDGRVNVFEWAPVVGTGDEQKGWSLDGDVWRSCNTTQVGEQLQLTCFVKGGLGSCTFLYMCAYGPCNTSTIPPLASDPESVVPMNDDSSDDMFMSSESEEEDEDCEDEDEDDMDVDEFAEGELSDEEYYDNYDGDLPRRFFTWRDLPGIANITAPMATQCQVASFLRNVGFATSLAKMVCTAFYESSWNCGAKHMNTDGSQDYGLLQVNSYWWCSGGPRSRYNGCQATCDSMLDCQANAKCARTIFDQQGVTAWYAYKAHKAECDSYYLPC
jgi:hypothetical protein